jgi:hypothetical protein
MFGNKMKPRREIERDDGGADLSSGSIGLGQREKQKVKWQERWEDSKGMLLILCSELFGTGMAAAARLLQMGDDGMMTLQVSIPNRPVISGTNSEKKKVDHVCPFHYHIRIKLFILLAHKDARFPIWEAWNPVVARAQRLWGHCRRVWVLL